MAAVQLPNVSDVEFESSLAELRDLAKTLGYEITATFTQKRASFDSTAYLGVGKREEIRAFVDNEPTPAEPERTLYAAADPNVGNIEVVFVDHEISAVAGAQPREETGCEVMDRTQVILEIFHHHARSRAARAQVEIVAPAVHDAAPARERQAGKDRQRGGIGGKGAGESALELDRRKIRDRIAELNVEITAMEAERRTQRARRTERRQSRAWRSSATRTRASPP